MTDHPRTICTDLDLGTQPDSLHVESALRLDRQNPSARFIVPGQEGTFALPPQQPPYPSETARLVTAVAESRAAEVVKCRRHQVLCCQRHLQAQEGR